MNEEHDVLRELLDESATRVTVGSAPVEATMHRGRVLRGRRRAAQVAAAVAAVCALGFGVGIGLGSTDTERGAAASPPATPWLPRPMPPPEPVVVEPEQRVDLGHGVTVRLTADGEYATGSTPGSDLVKSVMGDNFAVGSVSFGAFGHTATILYVGAYRGEPPAARITVTVAGSVLDAQILTLAGDPGWSVYYVEGPSPQPTEKAGSPAPATSVDVYARDGRRLATSAAPPTNNQP
ncbi:hypothetical protein [Embleya scabrispora]|uniref:hypothetical protein n=1 Tax=Embleya scabrispora TaxID=159449 RepID=UPI000377B945|nr:hypothetical protein [Embleya scabrispora]MYS80190.1 hypothetical protein [Streptomyces sp. SID5474]